MHETKLPIEMLQRIMLIDDDEDDREFFCFAIKEIDKSIVINCCTSGANALTLLQDSNTLLPQLIFLDINMPGHSGKDTLIALKKWDRTNAIPVIMYSSSELERDEMKQLGAAHYLIKPNRLIVIIEELTPIIEMYRQP